MDLKLDDKGAVVVVDGKPVYVAPDGKDAATALVNYAATHWAEVANLNEFVKDYWPQVVPKYPIGKDGASAS